MIRTRFSPSPTGFVHIGGIRNALYCYAMAKKNGGKYLLRIEDTDQNRFIEGATEEIYEMLEAYGVVPDESDKHGGDYGPYTQSKRLDLYKKYADELIANGFAYKCFLAPEEATQIKEANRETHAAFRSPHRELSADELAELEASGKPFVIRFKTPDNREIKFKDGIQGEMSFNTDFLDDQVLLKSDGFPTYHLAMLVDDHLMEISDVFRGFEWIPSIPLHVLLYEAMGWEMPHLFHFAVILDPDGGKLSKRKGTVSAKTFLEEGYLVEAIMNFLMLIGWTPPIEREHGEAEREIFSQDDFVQMFDTKDLNKTNAIFNREKLLWFNKQYLANTPSQELASKLINWLETYAQDKSLLESIKSDESLAAKLELVKTRSEKLTDLVSSLKFFYVSPENINWEIKQLDKVTDKVAALKTDIYEFMQSLSEDATTWTHEQWEAGMRAIGDKHAVKHGDVFMVLRVAIVGEPFSPPLFESLQLLGKEEVLSRLS